MLKAILTELLDADFPTVSSFVLGYKSYIKMWIQNQADTSVKKFLKDYFKDKFKKVVDDIVDKIGDVNRNNSSLSPNAWFELFLIKMKVQKQVVPLIDET